MGALRQAIELEPGNASSYNSRGLVHDKLGRLDEALADFSQVRPNVGLALTLLESGISVTLGLALTLLESGISVT